MILPNREPDFITNCGEYLFWWEEKIQHNTLTPYSYKIDYFVNHEDGSLSVRWVASYSDLVPTWRNYYSRVQREIDEAYRHYLVERALLHD